MRTRALLWSCALAGACGGHPVAPPAPMHLLTFAVLGNASPADTGAPTLTIDSQVVIIRCIFIEGSAAAG